MMKNWVVLLFVFVLSHAEFLLAGEVMNLTESDSGKTVELKVGDELEIALSANPTTGYTWDVSMVDSAVLKLDKSDFLAGDSIVGSGGTTVMKFHAIAPGTSGVKLIYHRPFEHNKPPIKVFLINTLINNN